jgi:hypothetical protein
MYMKRSGRVMFAALIDGDAVAASVDGLESDDNTPQ